MGFAESSNPRYGLASVLDTPNGACEALDEALDPSPDHGPARSFGAPDLRLTGSIDRMTLEKAVESLPAGYRLIFVLHDIEGYEHEEIANMLKVTVGTSKSQLHKARMRLRQLLTKKAG